MGKRNRRWARSLRIESNPVAVAMRPRGRGIGAAVFLTLVGVLLTALSIKGATTELDLRSLSLESERWTEVAGSIERSDVHVFRNSRRTSYEPDIIYDYNVDGRSFTGRRVLFANDVSESRAHELVAAYRPGDSAIVWIRPGDPSVSVLQRESWDAWPALAAWLFFVVAFGGMTLVTASSVFTTRPRLWDGKASNPTAPGAARELGEHAVPTRILGTFAEASDRRVIFVRRSRGPEWRLALAAIGAVVGPALAPLAPMACWLMALLVLFPALSLALAYGALPELALSLSTLAPLRHRLRVERDAPDPYRGEPVCTGRVDGRTFEPDTRRALFDVRIDWLVAHVLVIGARASIVAYAFGRGASAALQRSGEEPSAGSPGSMADLAAALERALHVEKRSARPDTRLPPLAWWPLGVWLWFRAVLYVAVAIYTPLDPLLGLVVGVASGFAALAIEVNAVRGALAVAFVPAIDALGRELRAKA
jgi:hypothetical protein